ncbi:hypothetical protein C8Q75DRAFT_809166 [Abortiporus biennis]|nr:hypothetical protein C8Q75DRAFT_809166 [Abortiporus biennis]
MKDRVLQATLFLWGLVFLPTSLGQETNATCDTLLNPWMRNSLGQNPCEVNSMINAACSATGWFTPALALGSVSYGGLGIGDASICSCSLVAFSLLSACQYCQGFNIDLPTYNNYAKNCPASEKLNGFSHTIPSDTAIPAWAYVPLNALDTWDYFAAFLAAESALPDSGLPPGSIPTSADNPFTTPFVPATSFPTPTIPSFTFASAPTFSIVEPTFSPIGEGGESGSSSTKTKPKVRTNKAAIGGGVGGGAGGLLIIGAGGVILVRRRRRQQYGSQQPHPGSVLATPPDEQDKYGGAIENVSTAVDMMNQVNNIANSMPQLSPAFNADSSNAMNSGMNQAFDPTSIGATANQSLDPSSINTGSNQVYDPSSVNTGYTQGYDTNMINQGLAQGFTSGSQNAGVGGTGFTSGFSNV